MPKQKTDDLVTLINSLSRAEKRHFRLFVKRNQNSEDILFLQLFDFLEKKGEYDEDHILKKITINDLIVIFFFSFLTKTYMII